ncbi:ESCRT-II complex, Vps25 subunit [Fusarium oxysporum f. sp. vasinfectum]|nr:ESCRT-II complex, Vps25 subunit [Fusarium oxysporum f. sp. vasinfectum]
MDLSHVFSLTGTLAVEPLPRHRLSPSNPQHHTTITNLDNGDYHRILLRIPPRRNKWSDLILAYARHNRIFRLSLSEAADSDLFVNRKLDRRLQFDDIRDVISYMHTDGRVEYVGGKTTGDVVFLYWRKPEEWAELVENYVEETGQKGSVLTVYELVEGDGTKGNDIHGMDTDVLLKALNILVKRNKAQIFGQDDSLGVKFF